MRLGILIEDTEYRDILVEKLITYNNGIFVNILSGSVIDTSDSLILTDLPPERIDSRSLEAVRDRIVFLTSTETDSREGINSIFKYSSIPIISAGLSYFHDLWQGSGPIGSMPTRFIAVISESDVFSSDRCRSLARQIIYREGGSLLLLPLSYINDYAFIDSPKQSCMPRMMYSLRTGRRFEYERFTYTDSYGISYLLAGPGKNRLAYLDEDELKSCIRGLASRYDTVIGDMATCFRPENVSLIDNACNVIFFENGRRDPDIADLTSTDISDRLIRIRLSGDASEAGAIDDCIKRIYGKRTDGHYESQNDSKVW